jgi:hypothetical protein
MRDFAMPDIGYCLPAIALAQARRAGMLDEKQNRADARYLMHDTRYWIWDIR